MASFKTQIQNLLSKTPFPVFTRKKLFKMPNNIPFDIQIEIISDVKSLIQFRSVSKAWKAFIDSSEFIKGYGARDTQPRSHILSYIDHDDWNGDANNTFLVDETLKVQKQELFLSDMYPLLKEYCNTFLLGASHGLLCWIGYTYEYDKKDMVVIWNPSIRKSVGIFVPVQISNLGYQLVVYGFGVCPITSDPTVIQVIHSNLAPCHAEVFTLSLGVWNVIPSGNLPRQSIKLDSSSQVVIDRFIYWGAHATFAKYHHEYINNMVVSFDMITKEFNAIDLPYSLTKNLVSVSKLRESLVVCGHIYVTGKGNHCDVWVMEHDLSFRKIFTIGEEVRIVGFKENGETIFERKEEENTRVDVYDPCSQQIKNLGISGGIDGSFFMGSYKESLLLLDHPDLHMYCDDS